MIRKRGGDVWTDEEEAEGGEGGELVEELFEEGEKRAFVRRCRVDDVQDEGWARGDVKAGEGGKDGQDWREGFGKDAVDLCGGGSRGRKVRGEEVGFPGRW